MKRNALEAERELEHSDEEDSFSEEIRKARELSRRQYLHDRVDKQSVALEMAIKRDRIELEEGEAVPDRLEALENKEKLRDIVYEYRKPTLTKRADIAFEEDQLRKAGIDLTIDDRVSFIFGQTSGEEDHRPPPSDDIRDVRESLPISRYRDEIIQTIKDPRIPVVIVSAATGSGKTTQIPQFVYEAGIASASKRVACTQPRRVAAMSVAMRVDKEAHATNPGLPKLVSGYTIRFEDHTSDDTAIQFLTDGMLIRQMLSDPRLSSFSVLMIDEAHERTLQTDILFAMVKQLLLARNDPASPWYDPFTVVISSATLERLKFRDFFRMKLGDTTFEPPILEVPGRRFPVSIYYSVDPVRGYVPAAVLTILQVHFTQGPGDILVFLTGQEEIEDAQRQLREQHDTAVRNGLECAEEEMAEIIIVPLYASLPRAQQMDVFAPTPRHARKIVLSTNIAETSLTIDNIVYVVDSGYVKMKDFDEDTGAEALQIVPISKASAEQRAGRAGRVAPGHCFRLYTADAFKRELPESTKPEIQRTKLDSPLLMLKSIGIDNPFGTDLDFLDCPAPEQVRLAAGGLLTLGALQVSAVDTAAVMRRTMVTEMGKLVAQLPMEPAMGVALYAGQQHGCLREMLSVVAMLSADWDPFFKPRTKQGQREAATAHEGFVSQEGDHLTLLSLFNAWSSVPDAQRDQWCHDNFVHARAMQRAADIRVQLMNMLGSAEPVSCALGDGTIPAEPVLRALCQGFFMNTASYVGGPYRLVRPPLDVRVHPSSKFARPPPGGKMPGFVLFHQVVKTRCVYIKTVSKIEKAWVEDLLQRYGKIALDMM
ncbi:Helicase associated domain (HA2) [Carpediemonas membranifera]|uniref:RNA helicase n=1 Tax=Carpediemonas membranifera TaxID=201153 RepID=A0A8J6AZ66_9EUKA|nr:Helicase associated domain (HA2) [Carpediemonas membranifera]|eukprot:KAG9389519.1 Helicase associated domain (HA2) [Carpediemonas membranifera]